MSINYISREEWGAKAPTGKIPGIPVPTPRLWLHHTYTDVSGVTGMRKLQQIAFDRDFFDISYSIVLDLDTHQVYEGRGFGKRGAHTKYDNSTSHAIALMGNYQPFEIDSHPETKIISEMDILFIARVAAWGYKQKYWPNQFTGGHRDHWAANTLCPGDNAQNALPAINKRIISLLRGETMYSPSLVVYAERGIDFLSATAAHSAAPVGICTADFSEASRAKTTDVPLVVVGGPAAIRLKLPHTIGKVERKDNFIIVVGNTAAHTGQLVYEIALKGWK